MCARLREANERLREETAARIGALEQLRHADRLRTVGTLASGIAHELGTPLNVVSGRAKMVATGEAAGEEAAQSAGSSSSRWTASPGSFASCWTLPAGARPIGAGRSWRRSSSRP